MTQLERLRELEEILNVKLKQVNYEDIAKKDFFSVNPFDYVSSFRKSPSFPFKGSRTYCVNKNGKITGLSLDFLPLYLLPEDFLLHFPELEFISCRTSGVQNFSFLAKLNRLRCIDLNSNNISGLSFLKELTGLTSLYLSNTDLEDYSYLKELTGLTSLDLGLNNLTVVSFLKELTGLTSLILSNTKLNDYSFLKELTGLTSLNLSDTKLNDYSFLIELKGLTSLDLSFNYLNDISFLKELTGLTSLDLSWNNLTEVSFLTELKGLISLGLSWNQLTEVSFLKELRGLTSLDLSWNRLTEVPFLKELKDLTSLDLSYNNLTDVSFLKELKGLTSLDLSYNMLTDVSFLKELKDLTWLNLSNNNKLQDVSFLKKLKGLTSLNLSHNKLTDVLFLKELKGLTSLYLSSNKLTNVLFLKELKGLTSLNLRSNKLTDVSFLKELKYLTSLDLSNTELKDYSFLKELKGLTSLHLFSNNLTDVSFLKESKYITTLDLRGNQIKELPEWITELRSEIDAEPADSKNGYITLYGNPIETPPLEIVKKGKEAIRDYYRQAAEQGGFETMYEAKVLIVGEGGSGKTTLFKKLQDNSVRLPDTSSTLGVEVKEGLELPCPGKSGVTIKANLWDFGGQEIQYQLHQYFITPDALYILVADNRRQNTRWDYWFQVINLLGGKCPVMVVINNVKTISTVSDFQRDKCRENFSELDIIELNVDFDNNDVKWTSLKEEICRLLAALPLVNKPVPRLWKNVRDKLSENKKNYIYIKEFFEICESIGLKKAEDSLSALEYFHEIGLLLHFKNDENLRDIVFLNPNWITGGLYAALHSDNKDIENGIFTSTWINEYWENHVNHYNYDERTYLLRLMLKDNFDICYPLEGGRYMVPMLLPKTVPVYKWSNEENLNFRFQYPFMPEGIISRLIVRLNDLIYEKKVWREGVLLHSKNNPDVMAEIIQKTDTKTGLKFIGIRVKGGVLNERKEFLSIIRGQVEYIHKTAFSKINVSEMVVCNCMQCRNSAEPHYYPLEVLNNFIRQGKTHKECDKSTESVSITELFGAVYNWEEMQGKMAASKQETIMDKKSLTPEVYFSYAWDDVDSESSGRSREEIVYRLYESLKDDGITVKRDKNDLGYRGLINDFMEEIGRGKLIVVAITMKYLHSQYCMGELLEIHKVNQNKLNVLSGRILPIWIEPLKLNDRKFKAELFDYWDKEAQENEKYFENYGKKLGDVGKVEYERIRDIALNIGRLIENLAEMNSLTKEKLSENNFEIIKKEIKKNIE